MASLNNVIPALMNVRQTDRRFVLATALTLLAVAAERSVVAGAAEVSSAAAASDDLNTVRQRILAPLLEPVPGETARKLLDTLEPDGSWPDINYKDRSPAGWKTAAHLNNVATLARA